jgi:hypothetical protein
MLPWIRRIKCDERKPQCERCASTGRNCDGYDPLRALPFEISPRPRRAKELPPISGTHCTKTLPHIAKAFIDYGHSILELLIVQMSLNLDPNGQ